MKKTPEQARAEFDEALFVLWCAIHLRYWVVRCAVVNIWRRLRP